MSPAAVEFAVLDTDVVAHESILQLPPPVDVTPDGHELSLSWRAVAGATGARVSSSVVNSWPNTAASARLLGLGSPGKSTVTSIVVDSPVPGALIRSIRISTLERHDGEDRIRIRSSADLGGFRLVLTPIVGGQDQAPIVAVPQLGQRNALPAQLVGGSLSGESFELPDVVGAKFRITLVDGDAPEDFERETFSHGDVFIYAVASPVGLHVDGPDGAEQFAMGGPLTSTSSVDVKAALQRHLDAVVANDPIAATVTVRSDIVGSASVSWTTTGGVIERAVDGRPSVDGTGAPTRIALPPPHPGRAPNRTVADVTVVHHGLALHPISDPVPTVDAGLGGLTVHDVAVTRALPVDALLDQYVRQVAVVGWALALTDLSLTVLGHTSTVSDLAGPTQRAAPDVVWFEFAEPVLVDAPVSIALTATRGAFAWIADPQPLVRIAIAAAPNGERVTVGGHVVVLTGDETLVTGAALAGTDGWDVATDQFCTVALSNAIMEFAP